MLGLQRTADVGKPEGLELVGAFSPFSTCVSRLTSHWLSRSNVYPLDVLGLDSRSFPFLSAFITIIETVSQKSGERVASITV